jgi:putative endonuclease
LRDLAEVAVTYYVYILASRSRNLYIGVTNDLERRVYEHKKKLVPGFTTKYNIDRLVYFETTQDVEVAISREKQIKGWLRTKKISLIESMNPTWDDLSARWFEEKRSV